MNSNCINCKFHSVIPDPDLNDSFNSDDVAIICTKVEKEVDKNSKYLVDRQKFKAIDVALRPYQVKKVKSPDWCPISIKNLRDQKIDDIIYERD